MGTRAEFNFLLTLGQITGAYSEAIALMPGVEDPDPGAKVQEMGTRFAALEQKVDDLIVPRRCKKLHRELTRFAQRVGQAPSLAQRMVKAQGAKRAYWQGRLMATWKIAKMIKRRLDRQLDEFDQKYGQEIVK